MNSFEFQNYLMKEDFKKVENIFLTQCLEPKEFKQFNTSLGSYSKDYLSYLAAFSLIDGTIENNPNGYMKFFSIANGYTERFFQTTIYHVYNLSILYNKEDIFDNLIIAAKDYMKAGQFKTKEFKEIQFREYLNNIIQEIDLNSKFYELSDYQVYHKNLQSYLLQDKLNNELNTNIGHKKGNKI